MISLLLREHWRVKSRNRSYIIEVVLLFSNCKYKRIDNILQILWRYSQGEEVKVCVFSFVPCVSWSWMIKHGSWRALLLESAECLITLTQCCAEPVAGGKEGGDVPEWADMGRLSTATRAEYSWWGKHNELMDGWDRAQCNMDTISWHDKSQQGPVAKCNMKSLIYVSAS